MKLNSNQYNLSEKDVEQYLYEHPEAVGVDSWLARQLKLNSGILDLLGESGPGYLVLVELKNSEIKSEHLAQVCRYAHSLQESLPHDTYIEKVVIGKFDRLENTVLHEAVALDVVVKSFETSVDIGVSGSYHWTEEYVGIMDEQSRALAEMPELKHVWDIWKEENGEATDK